MAICANQGRVYVGTARQYMESPCQQQEVVPMRRIPSGCSCREKQTEGRRHCDWRKEDGCQPESLCMDLPLGVAYVNPQPYTGMVSAETALSRGSVFNNLYDPWNPGKHC